MITTTRAARVVVSERLGDQGTYLLHDEATLQQMAREAVGAARALGAEYAVASATDSGGISMGARGGEYESAVRIGSQAFAINIIDRNRRGTAMTMTLTPDAIRTAVERAVVIARHTEPDPDAQPVDSAQLAIDTPHVELYAPSGMDAEALGAAALDIEAAAIAAGSERACDVRVLTSNASSTETRVAMAIGAEFCRSTSSSLQERSCLVLAERGGMMARDYWFSADRRSQALEPLAVIAGKATARAVAQLGARAVATQTVPVLFEARVASSLVDEVVTALSGMPQYMKASFFTGALGSRVLAHHLDLLENPFEPFGLSSGAFDGEGVAGSRRHVVRNGVVESYFLSSSSARRLGLTSTGNASGAWNLRLTSDRTDTGDDLPAMLGKLDRGLFVTELLGGGVNGVTGAYSKAVSGFWVENGAAAFPVQDVIIAGRLPAMLANVVAVGADVFRSSNIRTGSILLESMQVAGR